MTDISPTASPHAPRAAMIVRRPSTARHIERPPDVLARQDRATTNWRRLRTIVDGLLRRAAASNDDAPAVGAPHPTPDEQESTHG
jgi:hypothetical protein